MAEWLLEEGIGESRVALVERGEIVEAAIELPNQWRAGTVADGRLAILIPRRRGVVTLADGDEALLEPLPPTLTEGASVRVEIIREAIPEPGRIKLARCRVTDQPLQDGPALGERLRRAGHKVTPMSNLPPDRLEEAGWSELLNEAIAGEIAFAGGSLRMSLTPAMTLFDVDGALAPNDLAHAGAAAAARAIRRFGLGGSIGIDLPTLPSRDARQAAAAAFDAVLPQPYERTAVNGFGFLQVVRKRERASLPELLQGDQVGSAARALLRTAQRSAGAGTRTIAAAPHVIARIEQNPAWLEELARSLGAPVRLQPEAGLAISAGHVHSQSA